MLWMIGTIAALAVIDLCLGDENGVGGYPHSERPAGLLGRRPQGWGPALCPQRGSWVAPNVPTFHSLTTGHWPLRSRQSS